MQSTVPSRTRHDRGRTSSCIRTCWCGQTPHEVAGHPLSGERRSTSRLGHRASRSPPAGSSANRALPGSRTVGEGAGAQTPLNRFERTLTPHISRGSFETTCEWFSSSPGTFLIPWTIRRWRPPQGMTARIHTTSIGSIGSSSGFYHAFRIPLRTLQECTVVSRQVTTDQNTHKAPKGARIRFRVRWDGLKNPYSPLEVST